MQIYNESCIALQLTVVISLLAMLVYDDIMYRVFNDYKKNHEMLYRYYAIEVWLHLS